MHTYLRRCKYALHSGTNFLLFVRKDAIRKEREKSDLVSLFACPKCHVHHAGITKEAEPRKTIRYKKKKERGKNMVSI